MSFARYPTYKDSGVEWLGEVPGHWDVKRLKLIASHNDETLDDSTDSDFEILYVDISSVDPMAGITAKEAMPFSAAPSRARRKVRDGDAIVSTVRTYLRAIARITNPEDNLIVSTGFAVIRPSEQVFHGFLGYLLTAGFFVDEVISRSVGVSYPAINASDLMRISVPVPEYLEQQTLATFLDRETAKIDGLIAEQRRLIDLLKEKRQAVISHAVTKGLNPDAPMKDSGVAWLGEVPEHWELGAVKRFFQILDGRRIPLSSEERSYKSGDYPYYGASGIIDSIDEFIFDEDLVLVSEDGANLVNRATSIAFVARGKYWVNNHAHILKPPDKHLIFWSERIEVIDLLPFVTGSAQPKLTVEALANLIIAVPPETGEREEIELFLIEQTTQLDTLTQEAQTAITLLQERRSALISAAVTGKMDVRGAVQRLRQAQPERA